MVTETAEPVALDKERFLRGWAKMPKRQREVLRYRCAGMNRKQIADQMFLSPFTIRGHMYNILSNFGLSGKSCVPKVCYWLGQMDGERRERSNSAAD
jgi:DNA-binding CsgD family transcriptional regulator